MSQIKIDTGNLSSIKSQLTSAQTQLENVGNKVMAISQSLDWRVKAKEQVDENLSMIRKNILSQCQMLREYAMAVDTTCNKFTETDTTSALKVENINEIISALSWTGSTGFSSIGEALNQLFKCGTLSAPFMLTSVPAISALLALVAKDSSNYMITDINNNLPSNGPEMWGALKNIYKVVDESDTFAKNIDALAGDTAVGELIGDVSDSGILKGIGYGKDIEKGYTAVKEGNWDDLWDLGVKYAKKGVKAIAKGVGFAAEEAGAYINIAFEFGENVLDIDKYAGLNSSYSDIGGLAAYMWHCTGGVLTDYAFDTAGGILEGADILLGTNFAGYYEDNFGSADAEGVYKAFGELVDGFKEVSVGQFMNSAIDYIGDSWSSFWDSLVSGPKMGNFNGGALGTGMGGGGKGF